MKALEALHDAGYTHGSLQPSNILNKNGAAVLIDLEFVKGDHKCGRKASVKENGLENNSDDFGCSEIYNVARKMDLWKKSGLCSILFIIDSRLTLCTLSIINSGPLGLPFSLIFRSSN